MALVRDKIIYWAAYGLARKEIVEALGSVEGIDFQNCTNLDEVLPALAGAKGLILFDAPEETARKVVAVLGQPESSVEWLHFISAGRDGFDRVGLPDHITVTGARSATASVVAEHALALTLALLRGVPQALAQAQQRIWSRAIVGQMSSLEDRSIAVVGYGGIGQAVARLLHGFGASVTVVTRTPPTTGTDGSFPIKPLTGLREVLADTDFLILTIALAQETAGMFSEDLLSAMKPGSYLVNVARGELVDLDALERLLRSGTLAGAALDVLTPEPFPEERSLWTAPNLIITPHIAAAASRAAARRIADGARQNMIAFLQRETAAS
jgi:phosphoglycerate dehydrogenase-like enzyme